MFVDYLFKVLYPDNWLSTKAESQLTVLNTASDSQGFRCIGLVPENSVSRLENLWKVFGGKCDVLGRMPTIDCSSWGK